MRMLLFVAAMGCGPGTRGDAGVDAPTMTVSGRYAPASLQGDDAGHPLLVGQLPKPGVLAARFADGTGVPVDPDPTGLFAFEAPLSQPYELVVSVPGSPVHEYVTDATTLALAERIPYRVGGTQAPQGTALEYRNTGNIAANLYATGSWGTAPGLLGPTMQVDWSRLGPYTAPFLASGARGDRVFLGEIDLVMNVNVLTAVREDAVELQAGVVVAIDPAPVAPVDVDCIQIDATPGTEASRLTTVYPELALAGQPKVSVEAVPAPVDALAGVSFVVASTALVADRPLNMPFSTPFPGFTTVLTRLVTGTTGSTFYTTRIDTRSPACIPKATDPLVALPAVPSLGGVSLAGDATVSATAGAATVDLSWEIAAPGEVDYWSVSLSDTTTHVNRGYATAARSVPIDATLLVAGHAYTVTVTAIYGHPLVGTGDFASFTYPQAFGSHTTPFTVQ